MIYARRSCLICSFAKEKVPALSNRYGSFAAARAEGRISLLNNIHDTPRSDINYVLISGLERYLRPRE